MRKKNNISEKWKKLKAVYIPCGCIGGEHHTVFTTIEDHFGLFDKKHNHYAFVIVYGLWTAARDSFWRRVKRAFWYLFKSDEYAVDAIIVPTRKVKEIKEFIDDVYELIIEEKNEEK